MQSRNATKAYKRATISYTIWLSTMCKGMPMNAVKNPILLNGFSVELSAPTVTIHTQPLSENTALQPLRDRYGADWFLYWRNGVLYGLPQTASPKRRFGTPITVTCTDHLQLIAARIANVLPDSFPQYMPFQRGRHFAFLGHKGEIVALVRNKMPTLAPLVAQFKIRPKYDLDAKIIELRDGEPFIGLFANVGTRWEIHASLADLAQAGVDLRGLYVVRRQPRAGQRHLVGMIKDIRDDIVLLAESFDDLDTIAVQEVWVEGSKASFARCLKILIGADYQRFEEERQHQEDSLLIGPAVQKMLNDMEGFLQRASPIQLTVGLTCTVTDPINVRNTPGYRTVIAAPAVEYCFDPAKTKRNQYPWPGIETYGPFSRDTFAKKSPRILVLCPDTIQGRVENFLRLLRDGVQVQGRSTYSAGFATTFGLVNPQFTISRVPLFGNAETPVSLLYRHAVEEYLAKDPSVLPDAAIVVIPDQHAELPDKDNPYLHAKAVLLMAGVPVQAVRAATLTKSPAALQNTLQNISIALYAKMNGTPWTVDHDLTINDELVVGMGVCELSGSRFQERQRYVGITTVFRGDGNYLLSNLSRECTFEDYPEVLRTTTLDILREIKERNGWRPGDTIRIVFHATNPMRHVEVARIIAECVDSLKGEHTIEFAFLTVSHDHPFRALDLAQQGILPKASTGGPKGIYAPQRGVILQLGRYTRLLCTNGPYLVKREHSPLPQPLLVHIHPQSTFWDLAYLTEQVLKFTSLSWRGTLPAAKPVTIYYSELIARLLARFRSLPYWSPEMLNVKLRASRWFL